MLHGERTLLLSINFSTTCLCEHCCSVSTSQHVCVNVTWWWWKKNAATSLSTSQNAYGISKCYMMVEENCFSVYQLLEKLIWMLHGESKLLLILKFSKCSCKFYTVKEDCSSLSSSPNVYINVTSWKKTAAHYQVLQNVYVNATWWKKIAPHYQLLKMFM
jgi:hypothetical protein